MSILEEKKFNIKWGDIGPRLITRLIQENGLVKEIYKEDYFYPIHYKHAMLALDPIHTANINEKVKNSYVYHCWNEILREKNINKNEIPPQKSFIYERFYGH
jgi:hypothetical protein